MTATTGDGLRAVVALALSVPAGDLSDDTGRGQLRPWNSLGHLHIAAAVEDAYDLRLTPREIRSFRTVGDLRALIVDHGVEP